MSALMSSKYEPVTKYIYNHDIMNCTAEGVAGNYLYSGRALAVTQPWDVIQLHEDLEPMWGDITEHYKRIGIKHSKDVVWHVHRDVLGQHAGFHPSVFYFGPNECLYWGDTQWLEAVEFINSKNNFMALADELGVDVPKTLCFSDAQAIDITSLSDELFPCYIKAAISVSGVGIYRCENKVELYQAIQTFDKDVPVQVQEEVITDTFLNLQYRIENDELIRLTASEQVLDGFVHQGNRVPSIYEPWDVVEPMAVWLKEHGMKGIFAFDVAVVQTDRGLRFPAIECNPRFNGATYPTLIAEKLNVVQWSSITASTNCTKLSDIDLSDIEYNPATRKGVIIFNWGTLPVGKLGVMLIGSLKEQAELMHEISRRF